MNRATLELFAPLDRSAPEPLRAQLEDAICAAITGGGAPPGTKLPASRTLAEALHVSRGVVTEAYAQIAAEGWIEIRRGAAPIVRAVPAAGIGPYGGPQPSTSRGQTPQRAFARKPLLRASVGSDPERLRRDGDGAGSDARFRGGRGRRRCGRCWRRCRTPRSTTATRAGTTSCGPSWPRIWCGCAGWWRRRTLVVDERVHAGAVADLPGAAGARGDAGRGRGPVARRRVGDDPLGGPGGRRAAGRRARRAARRARRGRGAGHARAPVPDRRGARARAAAGAAGVGRDRDRGRLRLRVPLRPRAGGDAAAARARPRRLPRHDVEDARARAAARAGSSPRRRSRPRSPASAGRSTPAARRSTPAPTPACSPSARSTATCAAPAASTASAATALVAALEQRLPACRVTGVAAGLHLLLRLPPGTDEAAVVARLAERRIRIRGLAGYRLTPRAGRSRAGDRLRPAAARRRSTRSPSNSS